MSHSVPSESSPAETILLFGADLVEFDRSDLPIYAKPQTLWADAGRDSTVYGAPLDRLYGEAPDVYVATFAINEEEREVAEALIPNHDPLVVLPHLADELILPVCEQRSTLDALSHGGPTPGVHALYDFGDQHLPLSVHEGWGWDLARPDWAYDHHI
jgi:hypothetical protein